MTSAICKARKRLFAHDEDAQRYAAADTFSEEYVVAQTDEGGTNHRKVCPAIHLFFLAQKRPHIPKIYLPHAET
jgi:hypothetical protein